MGDYQDYNDEMGRFVHQNQLVNYKQCFPINNRPDN